MKKLLRLLCSMALLNALTSCETMSATSQFYRPVTTQVFPPKPKDFPIPILGAAPKKKYEVIGRLSFSAGRDYGYMIKAIEYNARQAGADAAILVDSSSTSHQYTYTVPGYVATQPVTTYTTGLAYSAGNYCGSRGYGYGGSTYGSSTSTTYVPVYNPGYTGVGTVVRHSIDALMIVFK